MTNREWVVAHFSEWLFDQPMTNSASEWQSTICELADILSCDQQEVSHIRHSCTRHIKFHLILSYHQQHVSNIKSSSGMVFSSFFNDQQEVSHIVHVALRQCHPSHVLFYDQQRVSGFSHFSEGQPPHVVPWPTESEWYSSKMQSCHFLLYDPQEVSNMHILLKCRVVTSYPMINREWVSLPCHFCVRIEASSSQQGVRDIQVLFPEIQSHHFQ